MFTINFSAFKFKLYFMVQYNQLELRTDPLITYRSVDG